MFTRLARVLLALPLLVVVVQAAPDAPPTKLLRSPTVSATQIAFVYANNIWTVERAGGRARRLTSFQGQTTNPHFSPDGKWIAFSGDYAGNTDVYVIPAEGGEPKRLTWHPGGDSVQGWTHDGKAIMFASSRATWAPSGAPRFWTVPAEGGVEEPMALPRGYQGKISPDGARIAYRMNNSWDEERRNYRGGQNRPIWIVDLKTYDLVSPPWTDSKDMDPVWVGSTPSTSSPTATASRTCGRTRSAAKRLAQVTKFNDFDVKTMDAGAGRRGVRAGRRHPRARPEERAGARREHHGRRRLPLDDAALGGRDQPHDEHGALADRQARRRRGARRDLHDPGREGRRPQPDELERVGRARPGVVAGRQVRLVVQRQVGRVQARDRRAGRPQAAARDRAAVADALLHGVLVARLEEAPLHGHATCASGWWTSRAARRRRSAATRGWCRGARSTRCGAPTRSGWPTRRTSTRSTARSS